MSLWSDLPKDLLESIDKKLTFYHDKLRFSLTCKSWQLPLPKLPDLQYNLPWLLLPCDDDTNLRSSNTSCGIYNLQDMKIYPLDLQFGPGKRFRGSCHGWISVIGINPEIYMINPLTKVQVQLPPRSTFPDVVEFQSDNLNEEYVVWDVKRPQFITISSTDIRDNYTEKIVLFSSPLANNFFAIAIYGEFNRLAYCRHGDKKWTKLGDWICYEDVLYHNKKFYLLTCQGQLHVCEVDSDKLTVTPILPFVGKLYRGMSMYLVEQFGNILMILRDFHHPKNMVNDSNKLQSYHTCNFRVYKFDESSLRWRGVEDLDHDAIFVGLNSSLSVSGVPGCKANCIYFTDSTLFLHRDGIEGGFDNGVFNLESRKVESLPGYKCDSRLVCPLPMWFIPNSY